jgi:sterol desaturase/sphingolipid hydroxylase (fatty acid hydroxylase superfamily)
MDPQSVQTAVTASVLVGFIVMELVRGRFFPRQASREDNRLDVAVTLLFPLISLGVLASSTGLAFLLIPEQQGALAHWPWWSMLLTLLIADDLTQYWWHRLSHTSRFWPLHRAHHSASYMSVRVVYRNNAFYYAMMPGLWLSGLLIFLGFGWVYVAYAIVKVTVIIGAHSSVRWDEQLYRWPVTRPLMWVLERTISTPATHYAHHALTQDDGVGHYTGNFGNLLFLWDIIFGTAHITRRYPAEYGLADDREHGHEPWATQFLYPIFRSKRRATALHWPPGKPPE